MRVGDVIRLKKIDMFWDLGFEDMTSIWFGQLFGGQYRMIDAIDTDALAAAIEKAAGPTGDNMKAD